MTLEVKHSGVWRNSTAPEVKHSGVWRAVKTVEVKHSGVWRTIFTSGPVATFNTNGDGNFRLANTCYAGLYIGSVGTEYEYSSTGTLGSIGTWLQSGLNSEVWVECVLLSGSWNSLNAGTGTRLQCNTNRAWRIVKASAGTYSVSCNFKFWDAASGGNLLDETGTIFFTAEYGV